MLSDFLQANSVAAELVECPKQVMTAQQASDAMDVPLSSIVKTLLFMLDETPLLVVLSGDSRVSTSKLCAFRNAASCRLATPEEVEDMTGYEVGAVPPISVYGIPTLLDQKVLQLPFVVSGGGSTRHLLKISPHEIEQWGFDVSVADVCEP